MMKKGYKHLIGVLVLFLVFICSACKTEPTEVVEESFSNGAAKRIGYYKGEGEKRVKVREVTKHENGQTYTEGAIKNGEREGLWVSYYPGGQKWSECEFEKGKGNGKVTVWYENGTIRYIGYYSNGVPSGKWIYYGVNGDVAFEKDYDTNSQ